MKQIFTMLQDHPMTLYTVYQYHVSKNATNFLHLIKCTIYLCHLLIQGTIALHLIYCLL